MGGQATAKAGFHSKEAFEALLRSNLDFGIDRKNQNPRHYWHPFPAKFPPDLPRVFIEQLTLPGETVLDPMAGSCTTLIEAAAAGRTALGFDIDPLSLLLGQAKFSDLPAETILKRGKAVADKALWVLSNEKKGLWSNFETRFDAETRTFLHFWFKEETLLELTALLQGIEQEPDAAMQQFLKLVFSGIVITKSGGVTLSRDLAHTRPHKVVDKKPNPAIPEFLKRLNKLSAHFPPPLVAEAKIAPGNTKDLPLPDASTDLIVTSPPYANNAIDYMRAHKFSLVWFGHPIGQLKDTRRRYIGSEAFLPDTLVDLPAGAAQLVAQLAALHPAKGRALHRYYSEMKVALAEMHRVLRPERACAVVVATSILSGVDVQTPICLAEIACTLGFELVHIGERTIHRDGRMMPTSRNRADSQIETRMHKEHIVGLWKGR